MSRKLKWIRRTKPLAYLKLIKKKIRGNQGVQFVGQFNFSDLDREAHNEQHRKESEQIFLEDIGLLAFGRFVFYEPERKEWFRMLKEHISKNRDTVMKDLIDDIRKQVGRDPARTPKRKSSQELPKYWIITPPGSMVDKDGNPNKIRHLQEGPLNKSQVKLLETLGYDILEKNKFTFQQLKSMFPNIKKLSK